MKKMLLVLIGLIPFVLGFVMNSWLMDNPDSILPFKLIGILFLGFWVLVGFLTYKYDKKPYPSSLIIHLPALFVLFLIMYQDMVLEQFWPNFIGWVTQFYYLPLINISSSISSFMITGGYVQMYALCIVGFLLMYGSYYVGCYFKKVVSSK